MPEVFLTTEAAQERVVLRIFFCSFIFNTSSVKLRYAFVSYIRIIYYANQNVNRFTLSGRFSALFGKKTKADQTPPLF